MVGWRLRQNDTDKATENQGLTEIFSEENFIQTKKYCANTKTPKSEKETKLRKFLQQTGIQHPKNMEYRQSVCNKSDNYYSISNNGKK